MPFLFTYINGLLIWSTFTEFLIRKECKILWKLCLFVYIAVQHVTRESNKIISTRCSLYIWVSVPW